MLDPLWVRFCWGRVSTGFGLWAFIRGYCCLTPSGLILFGIDDGVFSFLVGTAHPTDVGSAAKSMAAGIVCRTFFPVAIEAPFCPGGAPLYARSWR